MPAARGTKRTASKSSTTTASSSAPKNKKKRAGVVHLEIPSLPTRRGRVLTCGQGDVGQLGLGEDVPETSRFKYVSALGEKIVAACAGGMHTVALDSDGKVWTFGCNDEGALGRATARDTDEGKPGAVSLPGRAVAVSAGDSHTAALLNNGDVYAWGAFRDSHGSMGLVVSGRAGKPCKEPVRIDVGEPAVTLASGSDHLVLLCASGSVYTMGCGEQGQLGRLSQRSASRDARQGFSALLVPSKVTLKSGASQIWAGYHATFALDSTGDKMFAWGLNNYGQLGIPGEKRKTALYLPVQCSTFSSSGGWRSVACGQHHSIALDGEGKVTALGRCEYGRLGLGDRTGDAETLEPIPKLADKRCVSIAAGTSNSFAVTDQGEVFAWGMGSEGQLGTGGEQDAPEPVPVSGAQMKDLKALQVAAGGQHTVLLMEDPSKAGTKSPEPEPETAEEKAEEDDKTEESEEEEKPPRPPKRQKKREDEVTSTSSASVADAAGEDKPTKVNGKDKKDAAMEVDEPDNAPKETTDTPKPEEPSKEEDTKMEQDKPETDPEPKPEQKPEIAEQKPETAEQKPETAEQKPETAEQKPADQPTEADKPETKKDDVKETNDVEMTEAIEGTVNGTPEVEEPKEKIVEKVAEGPTLTSGPAATTA